MKSLNTLLVAVVVIVFMCFTQVGQAQNQTSYPDANAYLDNFGSQVIRNNGLINARRIFLSNSAMYARFHGTPHAPQYWDVGEIHERTYNSSTTQPYTGPIDWFVFSPTGGNALATGTSTWSNSSNAIRVPKAKMQDGDIYCLVAVLDGELYGGQDNASLSTNGKPKWAMNDTWIYPASGPSGCGSSCEHWTHSTLNTDSRLPSAYKNLNLLGGKHVIRLHPRSTVYVPGRNPYVNCADLEVKYMRYNANTGKPETRFIKQTDNSGLCHFNVDWTPADQYEVFYDGCRHSAPRQTVGNSCSTLCFVVNAGRRVNQTLKQYDVPLQNCSVWIYNAATSEC